MFEVYINGVGNISPQRTFDNSQFLEEVVAVESNRLKCVDPNYKDYIGGDMVRRMSRIIKMGIAASSICLKDAGCQMSERSGDPAFAGPDAIISGTGLGCIEDTEKFLATLIRNNEEFLTPTSFIQSTHNTVSAQIALLLKCHNYNFTYVNRGISFETALLDSLLQIRLGQASTVLLGGVDELTDNSFTIMNRLGHWKRKAVNNLALFTDQTRGSIAGEGAAFFLLSPEKNENTYGKIVGMDTFFKPKDGAEVQTRIQQFLFRPNILPENIDLLLAGMNGDPSQDKVYKEIEHGMMKNTPTGFFKHLCGEYFTAGAFALWLAAKILKHQRVPDIVSQGYPGDKEIRNILIYNHYRNLDHSLMLISKE
jgi:3-oxoacyl-[acyl-carrier-protein] synthase II